MPGGVGAIHDQINSKMRLTGFGRFYDGEEVDWGFSPLQNRNDGEKFLPVTVHLPKVAQSLGITHILVPRPVFGRKVSRRSLLTTKIRIERGDARVTLLRGGEGDLCILAPGETYGISTAGCIVASIYYPGNETKGLKPKVMGAHLGLKCVIDFNKMLGKKPEWLSESVVCLIRDELASLPREEIQRVSVVIGFPIDPQDYTHAWNHEHHSDTNERLCYALVERWGEECILEWRDSELRKLGRINMEYLARAQFKEIGISEIESTMCYEQMLHSDGKPLWYTTRGPFREEKRRNLVLVTHLA
jgi:hypothetical protein